MASGEAMTRSQQKLLEAGRAKLAKHKDRNNKSKCRNINSSPERRSAILNTKIDGDGSPRVGRSPQASSNTSRDVIESIKLGREDLCRIDVEVGQRKRIEIELGDCSRNEGLFEDRSGQFSLSDVSANFKNETDGDQMQSEADEALKEEREAEEQGNIFAFMENIKRIQFEEEGIKNDECDDVEGLRRQLITAEFFKRKEYEVEGATRRESEADELKSLNCYNPEINRNREREAEEIKRKEREAGETKRKEHKTEDVWRWQCEEEEAGKKDLDYFSGLEQHIQDLTEQNFVLQREVAKARGTTQEDFAEHSAIVKNFNNQGLVVNQLKDDIEELVERIQEREAFAMVLMSERDRARQDFVAAREQSITMASKVVVLENCIRIMRSNQLKMEKDMADLDCEMNSLRKQTVNLEQSLVHFQSLIDALQEEKKVLQVRLRQIVPGEREVTCRNENFDGVQLRQLNFANASTFTNDLPSPLKITTEVPSNPLDNLFLEYRHHGRRSNEPLSCQSIGYSSYVSQTKECSESPLVQSPLSSNTYCNHLFSDLGSPSSSESTNNLRSGGYPSIQLPASFTSIPADLMKTICNINDIIISLREERKFTGNALKTESKGAADLRALNSNLSRQLESTTKQLDRLATQRILDRSSSSVPTTATNAAALQYVDEGDEVVDRMFTWIMQLFASRIST